MSIPAPCFEAKPAVAAERLSAIGTRPAHSAVAHCPESRIQPAPVSSVSPHLTVTSAALMSAAPMPASPQAASASCAHFTQTTSVQLLKLLLGAYNPTHE